MMTRRLLALIPAFLAGSANAQILLGQVDDFQDGTTMEWLGAGNPTNIANGGPLGTGDKFITVDTITAPHLAAYSETRWAGDWSAAGVKVLEADLKNMGAVPLEMRAVLVGPLGTRYTSTIATLLPPDGLWRHVFFPSTANHMTLVLGTDSFSSVASGAAKFVIRHQSGLPAAAGTGVTSVLGIDNVRASAFAQLAQEPFSYFRGSAVSGNSLTSVTASDDVRLVSRPGAVFSSLEYPIQINFPTTCPFDPSELRFSVEAQVSANVTQRILLKNISTGQFDIFDSVNGSLNADSVREIVVSGGSVASYMDPSTRQVLGRVAYRANAAVFAYPWLSRIDNVVWKAVP